MKLIVCYIGSTTEELTKRLKEHENAKRQFEQGKDCHMASEKNLKSGNYNIELLEKVSVNPQQELLQIEGQYIKNTPNVVNICLPGRLLNKYDENGNKHYQPYEEILSDMRTLIKSKLKFYYCKYGEETKKSEIVISKFEKMDDKNNDYKLEYCSFFDDSFEANNKKENNMIKNDLIIIKDMK
ncbi:MAG: hypothetical protein ACXVHR_05540 [Methanobacterium sp.]